MKRQGFRIPCQKLTLFRTWFLLAPFLLSFLHHILSWVWIPGALIVPSHSSMPSAFLPHPDTPLPPHDVVQCTGTWGCRQIAFPGTWGCRQIAYLVPNHIILGCRLVRGGAGRMLTQRHCLRLSQSPIGE